MSDLNAISLSKIELSNEEIQQNIISLENLKNDLTEQLYNGISNGISLNDQNKLTTKITAINEIINSLHQTSLNTYSFFKTNMDATAKSIEEQGYATSIVSNETLGMEHKVINLSQEQANKLRLIEINDYYSEQYLDRTNIMKSIILVCIPLIILTILKNKGLLSKNIFTLLIIIIIVVGGIYLIKLFLKAISHNNMQYQQYDWNFNINAAPPVDTGYPSGDPNAGLSSVTCSTTPL
jgi:hypothetical protein